jgi:histidyl-tRNA synthetase
MNQQIQNLKGFRDFLPVEAAKRKWLRDTLAQICEKWGFAPLETPTLEPLELFTGQIGEDEQLFFKFKDQGNRDVALRYDQTVPTCRVIAEYQNTLTFPFKRYQIQPAFRAEKPQKGRYREFIQCDADIFGVKTPEADAETIALSLDIYRQLGFKQVIAKISSRSLLKDIPYKAIVAIDKIKKIGNDGVIAEMVGKGISNSQAQEYLKTVTNLKPNEELKTIFEYLKTYGFPDDWYEFDPTIARSFSYSVGPIWEIVIPQYGNSSVLGGERYDGMLEKFTGRDIGGTGFGLGFDRTLEAVEACGLLPTIVNNAQILITIFTPSSKNDAITLSSKLRKSNISTELYTDPNAKLEKQLKYADKKGIPYVIVQGPDEVSKNVVQLKDMKSRTSETLTIKEVMDKLTN